MTTELLNLTTAAQMVGRHKATISRHVRDGYIPNHGSGRQKLVKLDEVQRALNEIVDIGKRHQSAAPLELQSGNPGRGGAQQSELAAAKLKHEALKAEVLQLKLQEQAGKLVSKDQVDRALFVAARSIRDRLQQLPKVLAPKLAQQDRDTVRTTLEAQIEEILQQLPGELALAMTDLDDIEDDDGGDEDSEE